MADSRLINDAGFHHSKENKYPVGGSSEKLRLASSLRDVKDFTLYKALIAEFVGTFFLIFLGCSCATRSDFPTSADNASVLEIALTFGLVIVIAVWSMAHISGAHFNPAVSIAAFVTRRISLVRTIFYIISQLVGAIAGAALYQSFLPKISKNFAINTVNPELTSGQGFVIEMFLTFMLVFTIFSVTDGRRKDLDGSIPLAIGLTVAVDHLAGIHLTGACMNPARSFGPALLANQLDNQWVYWLGPIVGGIIAGVFYDHVISPQSSISGIKSWVLSPTYTGPPEAPPRFDNNEEYPSEFENKLFTLPQDNGAHPN